MSSLIQRLPALDDVMMNTYAFRLANRAVISNIESEGIRTEIDGTTWWDVLPMINPEEHSPEVIDMVGEDLAYGLGCDLLMQHPNIPHLVRINETMRRHN